MPFQRERSSYPVAIGEIRIMLYSPDPTTNPTAPNTVTYAVAVLRDDGTFRVKEGDLAPLLSAQRLTSINNLLDAIRTQAVAEFLAPPPP